MPSEMYLQVFAEDEHMFLENYRKGLASLGIYYSKSGLRRRIKTLFNNDKTTFKIQLQFPEFWQLASSISVWHQQFELLNPAWIHAFTNVRSEITQLFHASYDEYLCEDKWLSQRAKRRLSYSANRLCTIGLDTGVVKQLESLILSQPWIFRSLGLLCKGMARYGYEDTIINVAQCSKYATVRAFALRAIAELPDFPSDILAEILWEVATNMKSSHVERLKATEALIEKRVHSGLSQHEYEAIIQQVGDNPYLQKNYIILYANDYSRHSHRFLWTLQSQASCTVTLNAIQYARHNGQDMESLLVEPKWIENYYSAYYPIFEDDEMVDPSPT